MAQSILIASPYPTLVNRLSTSLNDSGAEPGQFELHVAQTGHEALEIAANQPITVTILDADLIDQSLDYISTQLVKIHPEVRLVVLPPGNNALLSQLEMLPPHQMLCRNYTDVELFQKIGSQNGFAPGTGGGVQYGSVHPVTGQLAWLQDHDLSSQRLSNLLIATEAVAIVIVQSGQILTFSDQVLPLYVEEIASVVSRYWDDYKRRDIVRFVRLGEDKEGFLLFATHLQDDLVTTALYKPGTQVSRSRSQTRHLVKDILNLPPVVQIAPVSSVWINPADPQKSRSQTVTVVTNEIPEEPTVTAEEDRSEWLEEAQQISLKELLANMPSPDPQVPNDLFQPSSENVDKDSLWIAESPESQPEVESDSASEVQPSYMPGESEKDLLTRLDTVLVSDAAFTSSSSHPLVLDWIAEEPLLEEQGLIESTESSESENSTLDHLKPEGDDLSVPEWVERMAQAAGIESLARLRDQNLPSNEMITKGEDLIDGNGYPPGLDTLKHEAVPGLNGFQVASDGVEPVNLEVNPAQEQWEVDEASLEEPAQDINPESRELAFDTEPIRLSQNKEREVAIPGESPKPVDKPDVVDDQSDKMDAEQPLYPWEMPVQQDVSLILDNPVQQAVSNVPVPAASIADTRPNPVRPPATASDTPVSGQMIMHVTYTCLLIPRVPQHYLVGDLASCLLDALPRACQAFGWALDGITIRPEYLQWTLKVTPSVSPGNLVRITRLRTSEELFERFPNLLDLNLSGDFWAPGYLVVRGDQLPSIQLLRDFIYQTRKRQGIYRT